ncbi:hypothetical protein P4479_01400 [Brevibacillus agri]|nr:hypothetical protein [Brevibacillus agri]
MELFADLELARLYYNGTAATYGSGRPPRFFRDLAAAVESNAFTLSKIPVRIKIELMFVERKLPWYNIGKHVREIRGVSLCQNYPADNKP